MSIDTNSETKNDSAMENQRPLRTVSRRDVLKAGWTVPVVLAVAPPSLVLAGSGGNGGGDNPLPPPPDESPVGKCVGNSDRVDCSSVRVTGSCNGNIAVFTIANTGDSKGGQMTGSSEYRVYRNGQLESTGTFQLGGRQKITVEVASDCDEIRLEADQRPGHPGKSHPNAVVKCGNSCQDGNGENGHKGKGKKKNKK